MKNPKPILLRITEGEHALWKSKADAVGFSLSAYIRLTVNRAIGEEQPGEALFVGAPNANIKAMKAMAYPKIACGNARCARTGRCTCKSTADADS